MTWLPSSGMWHAADLTVLMHAQRNEAPESGWCAECQPDGTCPLLWWAVRVREREWAAYPAEPPGLFEAA